MPTQDEPNDPPIRSLILCADADVGRALAHWLRESGAEVDVPEDGKRAARMLRKVKYNAFVTDRFFAAVARARHVAAVEAQEA